MANAFYNSPAFTLGLMSPELQQFLWDDRYSTGSPTRMMKAPQGAQRAFGREQISLRQMLKDQGAAREAIGQRFAMAPYVAPGTKPRVANQKKATEDEGGQDALVSKYQSRMQGNNLPEEEPVVPSEWDAAYWAGVRGMTPSPQSQTSHLRRNALME